MTVDEVRLCTMLATERWLTKINSVDRPNYAKGKAEGRLEHELLATIRANICEWAVAKHYNVSWNVPWYPNDMHPQRKHIADIGKNGEVRSIRTQTSIPFWEKDKGKYIFGAKVIDAHNYTTVEIYHYFIADDYMLPEYYDNQTMGYRVPVDVLLALTV
jgi:hypothetical protein